MRITHPEWQAAQYFSSNFLTLTFPSQQSFFVCFFLFDSVVRLEVHIKSSKLFNISATLFTHIFTVNEFINLFFLCLFVFASSIRGKLHFQFHKLLSIENLLFITTLYDLKIFSWLDDQDGLLLDKLGIIIRNCQTQASYTIKIEKCFLICKKVSKNVK